MDEKIFKSNQIIFLRKENRKTKIGMQKEIVLRKRNTIHFQSVEISSSISEISENDRQFVLI